MTYSIKEIPYQMTWNIRHQVMWPNKSLEYVKLEKDEFGRHYGLYKEGELISIISLFVEDKRAQFRKFATVAHQQGKGYGTILMKHLLSIVATMEVEILWCNARVTKARFYERFGLVKTEKTFIKGGIPYVVMEKTL